MQSNSNYHILIQKLDEFIRKFYLNQLIRGVLFTAAILVSAYLLFSFLEYRFYFSTSVRKVLFYSFLGGAGFLLWNNIITPLLKYNRLGKTINHKTAASITGTIGKTGCCCIFINQLREKIGVMFGNPETTTGGNALKFYASQRLDIRRSGTAIKDKDGTITGNRVKVKVVKNKLAPPFRVAEFDIEYGHGISKNGEIVDLGAELNVLTKSGSWYAYEGTKVAQGRDSAKQFMEDNPEVAKEIEDKIRAKLANSKTIKVGGGDETGDE